MNKKGRGRSIKRFKFLVVQERERGRDLDKVFEEVERQIEVKRPLILVFKFSDDY